MAVSEAPLVRLIPCPMSASYLFIYLIRLVPSRVEGDLAKTVSRTNEWSNKQKKVAETQRKTKYNSQALEIALRENYLWDKKTKTIWGSDVQAGKLKRQHPVVPVPKSFILELKRFNNVSSLDLSHFARNSWLEVQTTAKPFYPVSLCFFFCFSHSSFILCNHSLLSVS